MRARRRACRFSFFFFVVVVLFDGWPRSSWLTFTWLFFRRLLLLLLYQRLLFGFLFFLGGWDLVFVCVFFLPARRGAATLGRHLYTRSDESKKKQENITNERPKRIKKHKATISNGCFLRPSRASDTGRAFFTVFFVFHYFFLPSWTPPQRSARSDWIFIQLLASFNLKTQKKKKKDEAVDFTSMLQPCNLTMGRTLLEIWCSTSLDLYCASE